MPSQDDAARGLLQNALRYLDAATGPRLRRACAARKA